MIDSPMGPVPSDWHVSTVGQVFKEFNGQIQTGPFGSQLHASDYVDVGIPVVMPANIGDNRILERGLSKVRPADADRLKRHKLQVGDIIFSRRGDVERRSLVRNREVGWLCGTGCLLLRTPAEGVDSEFLSQWFGHPVIRAWLTQHAIGATMLNLNTEILSSVPLVLPPLREQRAIAEVLGALDDKIESNRRLGNLADETLLTIWAVFAEPAPSLPIRDSVDFLNERIGSRQSAAVVLAAVNSGNLVPSSEYFTKRVYSSDISRYLAVPRWAFAYNPARVNIGSIGLNHSFELGAVSPVYVVAAAKSIAYAWWLELGLKTESVKSEIKVLSSGSVRQVLRASDFGSISIPTPSGLDLERFHDEISPFLALRSRAHDEIAVLENLRDELLPELLSGRLRVRDAETVLEDVV